MTRYEFVVMMERYLNPLRKYDHIVDGQMFEDYEEVPDWAKDSVRWMKHYNFVRGYEGNVFLGENSVLKQEFGVVLYRVLFPN